MYMFWRMTHVNFKNLEKRDRTDRLSHFHQTNLQEALIICNQ